MTDAPALTTLVSVFRLPHQSELLLDALRPVSQTGQTATAILPALSTDSLATLETSLAHADVARFARRRPVWRLNDGPPSIAWEHRTLSIPDLAGELMPECDVRKDPWLFRRLTRTLDRRVLALLAGTGELAGARPFALDLNAASLLSAEFLRFDAVLPSALRGKVMIALMAADIMADTAAFMFARGYARARGYRLMLRGATPALLHILEPEALEVDHVQLRWSEALAEVLPETMGAALPGRMVLFDTTDPVALDWGAKAGIRLFQGPAAQAVGLGEWSAAA